MEIRTVPASIHGRYLIEGDAAGRLLIGFHGYAENADQCLAQLRRIPGSGDWTLVAVQALHPFYQPRSGAVVASWMTSQDRELAIRENIEYIRSIVDTLPAASALVFLGFSQGAAMAYRAAASIPRSTGVIALGGDVPPDIEGPLPPVLIGRGRTDSWYTVEKLKDDLRFLGGRATVEVCEFDGGHEWSGAFLQAAGEFLREASLRPIS